jgi:hypothetical protein
MDKQVVRVVVEAEMALVELELPIKVMLVAMVQPIILLCLLLAVVVVLAALVQMVSKMLHRLELAEMVALEFHPL